MTYILTDYDKRLLRARDRCLTQIRDIFGTAQSFKMPHGYITERITNQVRNTPHYKRLTTYYKGYLDGIIDSRYDDLQRNHVTWQLFDLQTQRYYDSHSYDFAQHRMPDGSLPIDESKSRFVWTSSIVGDDAHAQDNAREY